MQGIDVKKQILKEIMDMADEAMLSKLKKPGQDEPAVEEKEGEMDMAKMVMSEKPEAADEEMPEPEMEIDPEMLQQLLDQLKEDK